MNFYRTPYTFLRRFSDKKQVFMKRIFSITGVLLLLLFLLIYPKEALAASREGMTLWLNTLIPTLLPFLILTGILLHNDGIERIFAPLSPVWNRLFGLSANGAYVLLLGLLCGYPMGAKLASDLYSYGKIDKREAHYLLTFCNNASPSFLITYLSHICLKDTLPLSKMIGILLLADFLCMLVFRFLVYHNQTISKPVLPKKETSHASSQGAVTDVSVIDVSIMNGFETIARLGGYILLFSILGALISHYWPFAPAGKYIVMGVMEITTGLNLLSSAPLAFPVLYLLSMVLTAFGGLCIMAQTKSVLKGELSLLPYASSKCLNALFTAVLVLILR
jgi:sporulation integral membrane protein YlbJ